MCETDPSPPPRKSAAERRGAPLPAPLAAEPCWRSPSFKLGVLSVSSFKFLKSLKEKVPLRRRRRRRRRSPRTALTESSEPQTPKRRDASVALGVVHLTTTCFVASGLAAGPEPRAGADPGNGAAPGPNEAERRASPPSSRANGGPGGGKRERTSRSGRVGSSSVEEVVGAEGSRAAGAPQPHGAWN